MEWMHIETRWFEMARRLQSAPPEPLPQSGFAQGPARLAQAEAGMVAAAGENDDTLAAAAM